MALPDVVFAELDARKIEAAVITGFEAAARLSGQADFQLYPGDPRRLFLEAVALLIAQQNSVIDLTGKGNLLRYAGNDTIEDIGWLYGPRGDRLQPSHALTTFEFTLSAVRSTVTTIAAGTRAIAGNLVFATIAPLDIPAGELTGRVTAVRDLPGPEGNGMLPGQIMTLIDRHPFIASVVNVTESAGGANVESLEAYRQRVRMLPESFSVAGPDGAYEFWAKTANPGIVDVRVWMPPLEQEVFMIFLSELFSSVDISNGVTNETAELWYDRFMDLCCETGTGPGNVNIAPLMEGGELPTQDILDAVEGILSDKTKRPLTDFVHVLSPVAVEYDVVFTYWIDEADAASAVAIQAAVTAAVDNYMLWQRSKIGRDIIPDELIWRVKAAGARRLVVQSPVYTVIGQGEVAQQRLVDVRYGGMERA